MPDVYSFSIYLLCLRSISTTVISTGMLKSLEELCCLLLQARAIPALETVM